VIPVTFSYPGFDQITSSPRCNGFRRGWLHVRVSVLDSVPARHQTGVTVNSTPSIEIQGPALGEVPEPVVSLSLHQLVTPPADFTGRTKDLADLIEKVRFDGTGIIGLFGMGGIGKTALALKLAEELTPRYPDAQLYLDLKGTSGRPLSASEVMTHVIRAYEPLSALPSLVADLEGKFRSVLNERRAILFLDNAADREQILALIPPEGCLLLVTSRQCFALPGMIEKNLDPLLPEEARELALRIAPRLESRAEEMAQLCGYLPLALRKAANMLVEHRDLSTENCMLRLSEPRERLALVESMIAPDYESLTPELQRLWRMLSVFPGGFDSVAAGTVWGINGGAPQNFLSELLACNMLQWSESPPLYKLHDLLRLWASAQCPDDERRSGQQKLAEYGATVLSRANEMYLQGGESMRQGLILFDTERPNIEAGWKWASANAEQDEFADRLCARYPVVGRDVLDIRQSPNERIQWLQAPLAAARRINDRYTETSLLGDVGTAYCSTGETQHAIEYHMQALTLAREIGERQREEHALRGLGLAYARKGDYPDALEYHQKSLAVACEIKDRRGESECLRGLAGVHHAMGVSSRSIELCDQALLIVKETADRSLEGECLGDLAAAHRALGQPRRAVDLGSQSLLIAREVRNVLAEGSILDTLGSCYAELGDTRRAIECHEARLKIVRHTGDRYGEGDALGNLGNALARSGDARRAAECYQELLKLVRELGDRRGEAMVLGNIGKARARLGETRLAIESHSEQLRVAREIGDRHTEGSALWNTSLALDKLGNRLQAITHAEAARKVFEETGDAECARVRKQLAEWTESARRSN
jgi:tetratricopeptide (TPR) repeat protein